MLSRCLDAADGSYESYGGRGITVCKRWVVGDGSLPGFDCFAIDMADRPSPEHTLDRVDNRLGYSPENCAWATKTVQNRNRRDNRLLTFRGVTKTAAAWAEDLGIPYHRLMQRLNKLHWPVERALTAPAHTRLGSFKNVPAASGSLLHGA